MLIAAAVRLWHLGDVNYWFDETFCLRLAEYPVHELIDRSARDTHPPGFFLLLKAWVGVFGTAPFPARMLSTMGSLATVAVAFLATRDLFFRDGLSRQSTASPLMSATLAGLLVALSPLQITWSHQVRMYSLGGFLAALSTWLFCRAVMSPAGTPRWIAYAITAIAALYMHTFLSLVIAAHALALATLTFRPAALSGELAPAQLRRGWMAFAGVAVAWAPWFSAILDQQRRVRSDFWTEAFRTEFLGRELVRVFGVAEWGAPPIELGFALGQALILILLALAMTRRPIPLILALTAGSSFLALVVASFFGRNLITARYFLFGQTLALIAIAFWVCLLPKPFRWSLATLLVGGSALAMVSYHTWRADAAGHPGLPALVADWESQRKGDEPLVFCSPMFYTTARVDRGSAEGMIVFGEESQYPFFVGTAILRPDEYWSLQQINASDVTTLWTCDFDADTDYLQPVRLSPDWRLVAEKVFREFNATFSLRLYERSRPEKPRPSLNSIAPQEKS